MARGMPSMLALLGLAAFAGYQNRDKIAEALRGAQDRRSTPGAPQSGLDGMLAGVGDLLGNVGQGGGGNVLTGGLGDLLDSFRSSGHAEAADSRVRPGPNQGLTSAQVEQAIGSDNLAELSKRTGLSHEELLQRLATSIPDTVDRLTPEGRLPASEDEAFKRLF